MANSSTVFKRLLTVLIIFLVCFVMFFVFHSRALILASFGVFLGMAFFECFRLFVPKVGLLGRCVAMVGTQFLLLGLYWAWRFDPGPGIMMQIAVPLVLSSLCLVAFTVYGYACQWLKSLSLLWLQLACILMALVGASSVVFLLVQSPLMLLYAMILVWLSDSAAWVFGYFAGRHLFFPAVSPKKTWEGFFGGWACCVLGGYVCWRFLGFESVFQVGIWGFIGLLSTVFFVSVLGDLYISVLKRLAGVKDTGRCLPGHGGMLDRLDGFLVALPVFSVCLIVLM